MSGNKNTLRNSKNAPPPPGRQKMPSERQRTLRDIRKLARTESLDALIAIIGCYKRRDGKIDPNADGRIVHAAAQSVIKIAYGEMPAYDPTMERPETVIDLEGMSLAERKKLLEVMDRITTVVSDTEDDGDDGPVFNGDRFGEVPLTIEGDAATPAEPPKKTGRPRKYQPPASVMAAIISPPVLKAGRRPKRVLVPGKLRKPRKNAAGSKPAVSLFDADF
jgi:hypothetical protein